MSFATLSVIEQLARTDRWVTDPRGSLPSGFQDLDRLLFRGGFQPGTFIIMAGRTHTRKTTVGLNMVARWLRGGARVGLVGLDETVPNYTLKLMSAMYGKPHEEIADEWSSDEVKNIRRRYREDAAHYVESHGYRPDRADLDVFLEEAEEITGGRLDVVVVDYITQLDKGQYGNELQKVTNVVDDLKVWTNEKDIITVALAQVSRDSHGKLGDNEGHLPLGASDVKYAGEEPADIILGTYRPALDPLGNDDEDEAMARLPDSWDIEKKMKAWERAVSRVAKYQHSTFLQLLKNRPGTKLLKKGIHLLSEGETIEMRSPLERRELQDA